MVIAQRKLIVESNGKRCDWVIRLEQEPSKEETPICLRVVIEAEGEPQAVYPVYGEDKLQALALSIDFIRGLLRRLSEKYINLKSEGQLDCL